MMLSAFNQHAAADRRLVLGLLGLLIALAWGTLALWGASPEGRLLQHDTLAEGIGAAPILITGWLLMIVAMMLPTTVPLVLMFATLVSRRPNRFVLVGLLVAGYLLVWTLFGIAIHLGDWLIHQAVTATPWLAANAWAIGAGTLLLAGAYQFTPLKYYCLEKCRSPFSFITSHWNGRRERWQALRLGLDHGLFCLGCCWSLMLLMFAVGAGNLGWMLLLGTLMAAEKNLPWGRRLSTPTGIGLLAVGGMVVISRVVGG